MLVTLPDPAQGQPPGGYFQMPISRQAQQVTLSVSTGTVDLVGYVESEGS